MSEDNYLVDLELEESTSEQQERSGPAEQKALKDKLKKDYRSLIEDHLERKRLQKELDYWDFI